MPLKEEFRTQGNFLFKHRTWLPLIFLGFALVAHAYFQFVETERSSFLSRTNYEYISLLVGLLGLFVRVYTVGYTPVGTSGRNTEKQIASQLNHTGIYSTVRHPLYVGNFLMWLGVAMLTENLWFIIAFIFIYWVYYEKIMYAEEEFLREKFGEDYVIWASKTPAFIPSFKNWEKPSLNFSLKKVFKKEKNSITGLLVLFYVFEIVGKLVKQKPINIDNSLWFYPAVISIVFYLIFRFLKRNTKLLDEKGR